MIRTFPFIALLCLLVVLPLAARAGDRVVVFAAASLQGALEDAVADWPGDVVVSYGGSGAMARQVAQGAPADLVVLADDRWMGWLVGEGVIADGAALPLLGNALVIVAPRGAPDLAGTDAQTLLDRLGDGRLAIGQTRAVPAGAYARAWAEDAGLWPALAPRLAETENVRAALALVARGEVPLGIVYATDAAAEPGVRVVHEIVLPDGVEITYPAAALSDAGAGLLAHLRGAGPAAAFARHGFLARHGGG